MPYVNNDIRNEVNHNLSILITDILNFTDKEDLNGTLNYCITRLICETLKTKYGNNWRYNAINDAIGILECAKLEYYRRLAGPYEDKAIAKNGDIDCYAKY